MASENIKELRSKMAVRASIVSKLQKSLVPMYLEVINESHMHSVPKDSETHFKVVVVADNFEGKTKLAQHRMIHNILEDELAGPVHALSIQAMKPGQWKDKAHAPPVSPSPTCMGGMKREQAGQ